MDFANAALLVGGVYALTEFFKKMFPTLDSKLVQLASIGIAIGFTFLLRYSVWASEQVVGDQNLDDLAVVDVIVAGLLLGLGANFVNVAVKAVRNIGDNEESEQTPGKVA